MPEFWAEWDREMSCGPGLDVLHGKARILASLSAVIQEIGWPRMDIYPHQKGQLLYFIPNLRLSLPPLPY